MRRGRFLLSLVCIAIGLGLADSQAARHEWRGQRFYLTTSRDELAALLAAATPADVALLEKLNRADEAHLDRLRAVVVPLSWTDDDLAYTVLPRRYAAAHASPKFLVVHLPGQLFGAYEFGTLVRWGPISSGGRGSPTSPGHFNLNWRSTGRSSTVNPDWFMRWYFNFGNREGLAFHAYSLPGYPASHGCIRLLDRDARWLYDWGASWVVDSQMRLLASGTPVFIVGSYDFEAPPPWRSNDWLSRDLELPPITAFESLTLGGEAGLIRAR